MIISLKKKGYLRTDILLLLKSLVARDFDCSKGAARSQLQHAAQE